MNLFLLIIVFLISSGILYVASEGIIKGLTRLSKFLGVTEFVLSFFIIAFAASIPNLFVGITSALKGFPELSFGDVIGNNIVALTIGIGLATLFSRNKEIAAENKTIKGTTVFTFLSALLPVALLYDGVLDRIDGLILIGFFFFYIYWLFSKKERFSKVYDEEEDELVDMTKFDNVLQGWKFFVKDIFRVLGGFLMLLVAAQGIVYAAENVALRLEVPMVLIGVLILGLGSALPEVYFAISSARKNETGIILGNIMGSVIIPATLILGIVSVINPIESENFGLFAINRIFVIIATTVFFVSVKTNSKVNRYEAWALISVYVIFVILTIFTF